MIKVNITTDNDAHRITAKGHALFNPGNDIVCSAVSALFYAFAGFLYNDDSVRHSYIKFDGGDAEIKAKGDIKQAFDMFVIGLLQIEKSYPKNIHIHIK